MRLVVTLSIFENQKNVLLERFFSLVVILFYFLIYFVKVYGFFDDVIVVRNFFSFHWLHERPGIFMTFQQIQNFLTRILKRSTLHSIEQLIMFCLSITCFLESRNISPVKSLISRFFPNFFRNSLMNNMIMNLTFNILHQNLLLILNFVHYGKVINVFHQDTLHQSRPFIIF